MEGCIPTSLVQPPENAAKKIVEANIILKGLQHNVKEANHQINYFWNRKNNYGFQTPYTQSKTKKRVFK